MASYLKRRKFIKVLSGTSALTLGGLAITDWVSAVTREAEQPLTSFAFRTRPYLQHPTTAGISIHWLTTGPSYSWVMYWPVGKENEKRKAETIVDGMVVAHNTLHKIRLTDLSPGQTYAYKVYSREITKFLPYEKSFGVTLESEEFHFTTVDPQKDSTELLILNDIHDRPHSFAQLEALYGNKDYEAVFLNGDMFDHQDSEQQLIDHLIAPCTATFASEKPLLYIRGNHETRGEFSYELANYFEHIDNRPYFSFSRGPVFFVALDTGEDKEDDHEAYYGLAAFDAFREEQAKWLEQELQRPAAKRARYRVVLMHIPPFHSGDWHGTMHCRQVFAPIFDRHRVDMVISGHTHRPGIHLAQADHPYAIVIGGGPKEGQRTLIKLHADPQALTVRLIADSGKELGQIVL